MSENLPADRTLVDAQRKIVDPWLSPLKKLEPLLTLTVDDFVTLKALIAAAQEAEETGGDSDVLDLPIDDNPLFSENYLIERKPNDTNWLVAMARFRSQQISTTSLVGGSATVITIPQTHPHVRLLIKGMSFSTTATATIRVSENGGGSYAAGAYYLFNDGALTGVSTGATDMNLTQFAGSGATAIFTMSIDIFDVLGGGNKLMKMDAVLDSSGLAFMGNYVITSTAAINQAEIRVSAGTFDAGSVELWGLP